MQNTEYKKIIFDNGIKLVMEKLPYFDSIAFGILINVGSRHENPQESGISHFIEHMHFKGTTSRSYLQISKELDALGGKINAITKHECIFFYGKILQENIYKLIDLFTDMFFNSTFPREELMKEKHVIIEEIQMYNDTPDELIFDKFLETIFGETSLAKPIIGKKEIIETITREDIFLFIDKNYFADRIIIAVAGNIDFSSMEAICRAAFGRTEKREIHQPKEKITLQKRVNHFQRDLEQVHIILGLEGLPYTAEQRFTLYVLNTILGGSMSSRLFQEIREKRGLAYAIYSYIYSFCDCGILGVYTGTSPQNYKEVIFIIKDELIKLKEEEIKEEELHIAKNILKGNFLLSLEDTMTCMIRLAETELYFGRYFSKEEIIKQIEEVTPDRVKKIVKDLLASDTLCVASIGNLPNKEYEKISHISLL